jgi:hypothetical protein
MSTIIERESGKTPPWMGVLELGRRRKKWFTIFYYR